MKIRNRKTLKNYFSNGQLPTQEHFHELIDSMLNMSDEGFRKTVENGEEISAAVNHDALLSFYRDQSLDQAEALWRLSLGGSSNSLQFRAQAGGEPLLNLGRDQRIGVGRSDPAAMLDVAGTVASTGRMGRHGAAHQGALLANGAWQTLLSGLHGCQAFELVAGAGGPQGSGHFSLLHAVALSSYGPRSGVLGWLGRRRGIRSTQAWWGQRCDRLELRWHFDPEKDKKGQYRLQIRTGCDFGAGQLIQAHLTELWFDPEMKQCQPQPGAKP